MTDLPKSGRQGYDAILGLECFAKLSVCCAETMKLSNLRVNYGFLRETIETMVIVAIDVLKADVY